MISKAGENSSKFHSLAGVYCRSANVDSPPEPSPLISRTLAHWQVGLIGVAAVLSAGSLFLNHNVRFAAVVFCLVASVSVGFGLILESNKEGRLPYVIMIGAGAAIIGEVAAAEYLPATAFGSRPYLACAGFNLTWAVLALCCNEMLAKRKARASDRTSSIDAVLVALGTGAVIWVYLVAPALQDVHWGEYERACYFAMVFAEVCLFGTIMRIAMSPVRRAAGLNLLVCGNLFVLLGNVVATRGMISFGQGFPISSIALISTGVLVVGVASAKSTAAYWDTRAELSSLTVSYARLIGTSLAVIAPLVLVMINRDDTLTSMGVGIIGICTAVLVTVRFAGLMQAHVVELQQESIISRNAISLASSVERRAMHEVALDSIVLLCGGRRAKAAIFSLRDDEWRFTAQSPSDSPLRHIGLDQVGDELLRLRSEFLRRGPDVQPRWYDDGAQGLWIIPISARQRLLGVVIVSDCPSISGVEKSLVRVACDLAIAEQTADASEDIHRRKSEQRFRSLVVNSQDLVAIVSSVGKITYVSPACSAILGRNEKDLIGERFVDLFDADNAENLRQAFASLVPNDSRLTMTEVDYRHPTKAVRQLIVTLTDLRGDDTVHGFVVNARDCTEQKSMEADLRHKAWFDDLTGIANRSLLREQVHTALGRSARTGEDCALVVLDLDDFKTVNDALGYPNGDEIIRVMAFRLAQYVREGDVVARLGGDVFAILLTHFRSSQEVLAITARILEVVEKSISFGPREVSLTASIGVAICTSDCTADSMLRDADVAMYKAKERGKGSVALFDASMHRSALERLDLKSDLSKALHNNELSLHYQPIVKLSGELLGFEALMRWIHPVRGFVSPATFIPLAEKSGLIVAMGEWALQKASQQLGEWQREHGLDDLTMSVNVSPRQLYSRDLIETVQQCLTANQLDPRSLIVEITESELVDDSVASEHLMLLSKLGVGIAADDFGSGFASYAALAQLPFTIVKMDRSLIQNLSDQYSNSHAQVRSIIDMAHGIGIQVTAEGIEEHKQREALEEMGCDKAQGYLFAKPLPVDEVAPVVTNRNLLKSYR